MTIDRPKWIDRFTTRALAGDDFDNIAMDLLEKPGTIDTDPESAADALFQDDPRP